MTPPAFHVLIYFLIISAIMISMKFYFSNQVDPVVHSMDLQEPEKHLLAGAIASNIDANFLKVLEKVVLCATNNN